jgi:uncharacterized membrane protein
MIKKIFTKSKKELTETMMDRGARQLIRLQVIIDVLFALMIFTLFQFMPRPEVDNFTRETMVETFAGSYINYLVIIIGIILLLIYWNQNNMLFGNLERTDAKHATISILSVFSLMLYLYFVRLDMELDGAVLALQMESVMLSLAGLLSIYSWHYAIKNGLVSDKITRLEQGSLYLKLLPEPIVAAATFPFAVFGPDIWTLAWLLLIPVSWLLKKYRSRLSFLALKEKEGDEG